MSPPSPVATSYVPVQVTLVAPPVVAGPTSCTVTWARQASIGVPHALSRTLLWMVPWMVMLVWCTGSVSASCQDTPGLAGVLSTSRGTVGEQVAAAAFCGWSCSLASPTCEVALPATPPTELALWLAVWNDAPNETSGVAQVSLKVYSPVLGDVAALITRSAVGPKASVVDPRVSDPFWRYGYEPFVAADSTSAFAGAGDDALGSKSGHGGGAGTGAAAGGGNA